MKLNNKRVLVTGGAGFIGSYIVDELVRRNCETTVMDDFSSGHPTNLEESLDSITLVDKSVTNRKAVEDNVDVDVIFHEAARNMLSSVISPVKDLSVTARGSLNKPGGAARRVRS